MTNQLSRKNLLVALAVLGLVVATSHTAVASLVDGGFEGGPLVDDGSGVGKWQPFADGSMGNTSDAGMSMPRTGDWALELNLVNANGFAGAFQDVALPAGTQFEYEGWHKETTAENGAGIEIRVEYRDSVGDTEISRTGNMTPASLGGQYEPFSIVDTIPAGADTARVVYAIQSFGAGVPQSIFVDDVDVHIIPEPTSLGLLGLAGLALLGLRRR